MNAAVRTGSGIAFGRHALPKPPGAGQVTVRVRSASINPVDYKVGKFLLGPIAGLDLAGVVEQVGDGVDAFKPGDAVFGFTSGSCCELTVADAAKLAPVPPGLDFTNSAALPTAYLTSYQSLFEHARLRPGGKVLIIGASGGCGLAACQLARAVGASEIVAVCSAANASLVESQGATRVVAYDGDDEPIAALLSEGARFDVVYDAATGSGAGEDYVNLCRKTVAPGGRRVAINGGAWKWIRALTGWQRDDNKLVLTRQNGAELTKIVDMLGGKPVPVIDSKWKLDEAGVAGAFERLKSRRARGKVIVEVA
jgi:NADPH:quinone reductase-like Zn-dependent oxidoreductase